MERVKSNVAGHEERGEVLEGGQRIGLAAAEASAKLARDLVERIENVV